MFLFELDLLRDKLYFKSLESHTYGLKNAFLFLVFIKGTPFTVDLCV